MPVASSLTLTSNIPVASVPLIIELPVLPTRSIFPIVVAWPVHCFQHICTYARHSWLLRFVINITQFKHTHFRSKHFVKHNSSKSIWCHVVRGKIATVWDYLFEKLMTSKFTLKYNRAKQWYSCQGQSKSLLLLFSLKNNAKTHTRTCFYGSWQWSSSMPDTSLITATVCPSCLTLFVCHSKITT